MKILEGFKKILGEEEYSSFLKLLRKIGPNSRTHRISIVIACILRYALSTITYDYEEGSLEEALVTVDEDHSSDGQGYQMLVELIDELCKEAGMSNYRVSARGNNYSIADSALAEYSRWYNMPWED